VQGLKEWVLQYGGIDPDNLEKLIKQDIDDFRAKKGPSDEAGAEFDKFNNLMNLMMKN